MSAFLNSTIDVSAVGRVLVGLLQLVMDANILIVHNFCNEAVWRTHVIEVYDHLMISEKVRAFIQKSLNGRRRFM